MSAIEAAGPKADGLQSTMERTQSVAAANLCSAAIAKISMENMPAVVMNSVQSLNTAVAQTKHAILSGSLSGDLRVSAAIGNLVVAASAIEHLVATLPPNLGAQVDMGG